MIPRIRTVQIKNYKSLASVSVDLEPLTVLVGPNGAGKSNFIDALAFVHTCASESVRNAIRQRGGLRHLRYAGSDGRLAPKKSLAEEGRIDVQPLDVGRHIGFRIVVEIGDEYLADYAFSIAAGVLSGMMEEAAGRINVVRERCVVRCQDELHEFELEGGRFIKEIQGISAQIMPDRLSIFAASYLEKFRPLYDFLTNMRFYCINPNAMRVPRDALPDDYLESDGGNAAAILKRMARDESGHARKELVCRLLGAMVEDMEEVRHEHIGEQETIRFRQLLGEGRAVNFSPANVSDGTLRITGVLLAAYQPGMHTLIAVEEPEATIHPAAMESLLEVFTDVAQERQVLLTTHSPDILDQKELTDAQIRVVTWSGGKTSIAPVSQTGRRSIRERLYTPGELLRVDELNPDPEIIRRGDEDVNIFGTPFQATGRVG